MSWKKESDKENAGRVALLGTEITIKELINKLVEQYAKINEAENRFFDTGDTEILDNVRADFDLLIKSKVDNIIEQLKRAKKGWIWE